MLVTHRDTDTGEGEPGHRLKGTVHLPTRPLNHPPQLFQSPLLSPNKTTCLFCRLCADTITRALCFVFSFFGSFFFLTNQ